MSRSVILRCPCGTVPPSSRPSPHWPALTKLSLTPPDIHHQYQCGKNHFPRKIYFPTQNLLSDPEVTICKYKYLIISVYISNDYGQVVCRGTVGGRKICKNLQLTEQREQSQAGLNSAESWRKKTKLNMTAVKKRKCKHLPNRFSSSLYILIR